MTKYTKSLRKSKINLWKKYKSTGDYNDLVEYKHVLNSVTREYRKAKLQFESKVATKVKTDVKSFYSYVRSKSATKEVIGPLKNATGQLITDDDEMCTILNKYFASVFTEEDKDITLPEVDVVFIGDQNEKLLDIHISQEIVYSHLKKIKANKSPGSALKYEF
jgi:hypothetical protein